MELQQLIRDNNKVEVVKVFDSLVSSVRLQGDSLCGNVDTLSLALLPDDVPKRQNETLTPLRSKGDGNCLFNSVSIFLKGSDCMAHTLRLLTAAELFTNSEKYANHSKIFKSEKPSPYISLLFSDEGENVRVKHGLKKAIIYEAKQTCEPRTWCSLLHFLPLANILQRNIISIYPQTNAGIRPFLHTRITPFTGARYQDIYIMWTRDGTLDNSPGFAFTPNHFVPLTWRQKADEDAFDDGDDALLAMAILQLADKKSEVLSQPGSKVPTQSNKANLTTAGLNKKDEVSGLSKEDNKQSESQDKKDEVSDLSEKDNKQAETLDQKDEISGLSEEDNKQAETLDQDVLSGLSEKDNKQTDTQAQKDEISEEDINQAETLDHKDEISEEDNKEAGTLDQDVLSGLSEEDNKQTETQDIKAEVSGLSEEDNKQAETLAQKDEISGLSEEDNKQAGTLDQDVLSGLSEEDNNQTETQDIKAEVSGLSEEDNKQAETLDQKDEISGLSEKDNKQAETLDQKDEISGLSEKDNKQAETLDEKDEISGKENKQTEAIDKYEISAVSKKKKHIAVNLGPKDEKDRKIIALKAPDQKTEISTLLQKDKKATKTLDPKPRPTALYLIETKEKTTEALENKVQVTDQPDINDEKPDDDNFGKLLSCSLNIASGIDISESMETDISSWDTDDEEPLKNKVARALNSEWDTDDDQPLFVSKRQSSTPISSETEDPLNITEICMPSHPEPDYKRKAQKRTKHMETFENKKAKISSDQSESESSDIELDYSGDSETDDESITKESFDVSSISWKKPFRAIKKKPFEGPSPGTTINLSCDATELDYFFRFFPKEILQEMSDSTNSYVPIYEAKRRRKEPEWTDTMFKPVSIDEIRAFLGVQMIMGVNVLPSCDDYWSSDLSLQNVLISQTMSRGRFRELKRYFHIRDPVKDPANIKDIEKRKQARKEDPLFKVQTLLDHVRQKSRDNYHLHEHVSIDEAMVKFHGRHWGVVGAPNKPAKKGFKIYTLADGETGYMSDFDVYLRSEKQFGSSQKVVEGLTNRLEGLNHVVYVDKYYTSIALAKSLLAKEIYICGSFNHVRKGWPTQLKPQKKLQKKNDPVRSLQRGESISFQSSDGKMIASVWKDSSLVSHLTTCYSSSASTVTRNIRNKEGHWNETQLNCPSSIKEYNKYMGGVDRHDHLRSNYTLQRSSTKWWHYFTWFAVDIALVNGYLSFAESHPKATHTKFHIEVAKQLIGGFTQKVYRPRQQATTSGVHLESERAMEHVCTQMGGRPRVCRQCTANKVKTRSGRTRETTYGCEQCKVNLHRECFQSFHEGKVKPKVEKCTTGTQTIHMATPTKHKSATPTRCSPRKLRKISYR